MEINTTTAIFAILNLILWVGMTGLFIYIVVLLIKALRKYLDAKPVREEKEKVAKSLSEVLKAHRTECKMTQEFVAEHLGVSRQAVSKWESGASAPNTTNLMMLAKLYGVEAEELLKEIKE